MKLYIKYMVSFRCKMLVQEKLRKLGIPYVSVELGEVEVSENISTEKLYQFKSALLTLGLELIEDKKAILIEKIKNVIVQMVHYSDEVPDTNNSDFLSEKLNHNYRHLAKIFSEVTGDTIEHYIIAQKIEKIKEFLSYNELNLTEISYRLNYSSVAHLSYQFKKFTGLTPTLFKSLNSNHRTALENV